MNDTAILPEVTSDEKTMATLAQVLQIVGWWIAPLVIYLVKRDSKFVAFHAMQALLWQVLLVFLWVAGFGLWFGVVFSTMIPHAGKSGAAQPPSPAIFIGFASMWLLFMFLGALNLVIAIFYGIKAGRGEWAAYPILGRWARHIVKV